MVKSGLTVFVNWYFYEIFDIISIRNRYKKLSKNLVFCFFNIFSSKYSLNIS